MNTELEKELKQDGQTIQEIAARRLADGKFSQNALKTAIKNQAVKSNRNRWWPVGIAAAVVMAFIVTLSIQNPEPRTHQLPQKILTSEAVLENIQTLPQTIGKGLQNPLANEQQAIIDDIKSFGKGLISI